MTGYNPRSSVTHPELGSWMSKLLTKKEDTLPNFVSINSRRSGTSGFFPGMYAALPVLDPNEGIKYSRIHKNVSEAEYAERHRMLNFLNNGFDSNHGNEATKAYSDVYQNSLNFMKSKDISAFDLSKEDASISKLYAKDEFSQGCLLAARLAEKGVRFSKIELNGWDYHKDLYKDLPGNANKLDKGLSALLQHLFLKGLLETTLVVVATEFGRKPEINVNVGRDHHPNGFTCLLAGAGVKAGEIYGKMSLDGKEPVENPIDITDFNATIGWALGLDPAAEVLSPTGRPFTFGNKGKAQKQLFQELSSHMHKKLLLKLIYILSVIQAITSLAAERPNIILIYTDDHGYTDLGIYGIDKYVDTPNMDNLARNGALMTAGYSTSTSMSAFTCRVNDWTYSKRIWFST